MPRHDIELTSPVDFLGPVCCSHPKPQILHSCCPLSPRDYHCMICVIESSNLALHPLRHGASLEFGGSWNTVLMCPTFELLISSRGYTFNILLKSPDAWHFEWNIYLVGSPQKWWSVSVISFAFIYGILSITVECTGSQRIKCRRREEEPNSQILPIEVSAGWRMLNCITQHFFCPCTWRGKNKQMGIRLLGCDRSPSSPWMNAAPLCASEALPYASNQPREGHGKGQRWGI